MIASGSDRRTLGTRSAQHRHLCLRFLAVVGAALTLSSLSQPLTVVATQPEPPAEPIEASTTTAAPAPTEPTTTAAPTPTAARPLHAPTPTEAATTTAAPTTIAAPTTTTPPVAAPSVVFAANAECDPAAGETTLVWEVTNNGAAPVQITDLTEPVALEPNPVPAFGSAEATRVIDGPATDQAVTSTVTIDAGGGVVIQRSDDITAPACEGPALPPDVTFTFTVTPSVTRAAVGDTVEYEYCGQNTSTIPLEVARLVDDRIGVVLEGGPVVAPGDSVCNTDVGAAVTYVVQESDAGSVIKNNAVVTVRTQEPAPRESQGTATSAVAVPLLRSQNKVTICHATGDDGYNRIAVNESAVEEGSGHNQDGHQDGRDIIPPGPWDPDGRNWAEGEAIHDADCGDPVPAIETGPGVSVVQSTCDGGAPTLATITTQPAEGVSYSLSPDPDVPPGSYDVSGGARTVSVTATLNRGYVWIDPLPDGWSPGNPAETAPATYAVELDAAPASCAVELPAEVAATQSVCDEGEASLASVTVPASVPGVVSYSLSPDPDVPPGSYDVSGGCADGDGDGDVGRGLCVWPSRWVTGSRTEPGDGDVCGACWRRRRCRVRWSCRRRWRRRSRCVTMVRRRWRR